MFKKEQNKKNSLRTPIAMKIESEATFDEYVNVTHFHILLINVLEVTLENC